MVTSLVMAKSIDTHLDQESIVRCPFMMEMVERLFAMSKDTGTVIKLCPAVASGFSSEVAEE